MLKNIIKGFKLYKDYFKNMVYENNNLMFTGFDINSEGYIIRQNSMQVLCVQKSSFCYCTKVTFENGYEIPLLLHDGFFRILSEDTKRFIIQHELGHYNLQPEIFESKTKRNIELEYEADEYAMNIVGKEIAIKAMNELKEIATIMNFGFKSKAIKEIDLRIENLMSK